MLAEGRIEPDFAVALAQVIAFAVRTAFVRTAGLDDRRNGNALLIDAHLPTKKEKRLIKIFHATKSRKKKEENLIISTFGTIGYQTGVNVLQTQIDIGRPARNDFPVNVEKRMRQDGNRLHSEFQPFVQVGAVQQTAVNVPKLSGRKKKHVNKSLDGCRSSSA